MSGIRGDLRRNAHNVGRRKIKVRFNVPGTQQNVTTHIFMPYRHNMSDIISKLNAKFEGRMKNIDRSHVKSLVCLKHMEPRKIEY